MQLLAIYPPYESGRKKDHKRRVRKESKNWTGKTEEKWYFFIMNVKGKSVKGFPGKKETFLVWTKKSIGNFDFFFTLLDSKKSFVLRFHQCKKNA